MHFTDLLATLPPALRDYVRELETRATLLETQAATLEQQRAALEQQTTELELQASALQARNQFLEEQFRLAQLKRFAPSSEKFGAQGCLFNEAEQDVATLAPDTEEEADKEPKSAGKKRGRKPLPAHLPRQRVEHDLPESEKVCRCCQGTLHRMGEDISEQLDIVPATVQVLQHIRFKYACRHCDRHGESSQIITSPMPPQPMPMPGSIASPATVATILIAKYTVGLPMYRLREVLLCGEVNVARTTLAQWAIKSGVLFASLYQAMRRVLLACPVIHGDETTVQVLKEDGRRAQNQSYMWVYRTALDSEHPVVLFEYRPGRGHEHPERSLAGFEGAVMTDGHPAWRMLEGIKHLGCMAHARRYFDEALKAQKNPAGRARDALRFTAKLYHIEKLARGKPPDGMTVIEQAYRLRQVLSRPILDNHARMACKKQERGHAAIADRQSHQLCAWAVALLVPIYRRRPVRHR